MASLVFRFTITAADKTELKDRWDYLLRIVGDFRIEVAARTLYSEAEFPLVEFGVTALKWLTSTEEPSGDFIYESMEAVEPGLVWIRRAADGWRVGSIHQEYSEGSVFSTEDIRLAVGLFVVDLRAALARDFGIDIQATLDAETRDG